MNNRLETLRNEVDRLIREYQPGKSQYFYSHIYGVSDFCTLLALRRGLNAELAAACGMLHDISQVTTGSSLNHAAIGAEQARDILKALGMYGEDETEEIAVAISRHSDKKSVHGPLDEVLKDADVLSHCLHNTAVPVKEKERLRFESLRSELGCVPKAAEPETFAIPGVGGIIIRDIDGVEHILLQTRCKANAPAENGLLEIPAGKIRAFEGLFDTLRREIKEETGLEVTEIFGENRHSVYEGNGYRVINFSPFSCAQNISGSYPIMVFVFICRVTGELLPFSDESKNYRWMPAAQVRRMLSETPEAFYPMHVDTLLKYTEQGYSGEA